MMKSVSVLKKNNNMLSLTFREKPYIIGFTSPIHAKYTSAWLHKDNVQMHLRRKHFEEVHDEINTSLIGMGMKPIHSHDVTIDVEAELYVPKAKELDMKNGIEIEHVPFADFIMFPFEKYLGVVMPFHQAYEDDDCVIFMSQVIDPSETIDMFKRTLSF